MTLYNLKTGVAAEAEIVPTVQLISGDGAITIQNALVILSKGSAAAVTLGIPTTAQNGTRITVMAITAQTHVVTCATIGFNALDASGDVATFGGAIADGFSFVAYGGEWYTTHNTNVTIA